MSAKAEPLINWTNPGREAGVWRLLVDGKARATLTRSIAPDSLFADGWRVQFTVRTRRPRSKTSAVEDRCITLRHGATLASAKKWVLVRLGLMLPATEVIDFETCG